MKVRFRALVIAVAVLVVLDLVLRLPGVQLPIPTGYRIPSRTLMGYNELVQSMSQQHGVRVAVVGDSIVWGGFSLPAQSISAYLQRSLGAEGIPNRSYNLGLVGAHANDLMPVVADLAERKAADVILLNFDYRFYDPRGTIAYRYPEVYDRVDWSKLPVAPALTRGEAKEATLTAQGRGDKVVSSVWKLYSIRDYLTTVIFGDTPANALHTDFSRWRAELSGKPLWTKRPVGRLPLKDLRSAFDIGPLTGDNPSLRFLGAALDAARAQGVPVVVFSGPVDTRLMDSQHLWDRAQYDRNLAFLKRYVEARGGIFYNYTDAVPGSDLIDSHHPLAAGNEELASIIASDIAPIARSAEASRAGTR